MYAYISMFVSYLISPPRPSVPWAAKPLQPVSSETAKIWSLSADDVLDADIVSTGASNNIDSSKFFNQASFLDPLVTN